MTQTTVYEYGMSVSDLGKVMRRTYPTPIKYEKEVGAEFRRMIDNNIERSNSNFLNPLAMVRKKDEIIRLCLDTCES